MVHVARYNRLQQTKTVTAEDVFKKYNISIQDKDAKKKTVIKLVEDYQNHKTKIFLKNHKTKVFFCHFNSRYLDTNIITVASLGEASTQYVPNYFFII